VNPINKQKPHTLSLFCISLILLSGCSQIEKPSASDPWEGVNRNIQSFNDDLDAAIMQPVAKSYRAITPKLVDTGITHAFSNLKDIGVAVNNGLQAKPKLASMDAARFLLNSTVGIAGIFDVATPMGLEKHEEDFGQTLAVWNMPSGPYIVLPFYGSSSARGLLGRVGDMALHPITYVGAFSSTGVGWGMAGLRAVEIVDTRADLLGLETVVEQAALDRYSFIRSAYQQQREHLIKDGESSESLKLDLDIEEDLYEGLD